MVLALLAAGADKNKTDLNGAIASDYAKAKNHKPPETADVPKSAAVFYRSDIQSGFAKPISRASVD